MSRVKVQQLDQPILNAYLSRNALINSNFDVWQRGTSLALADNTSSFLADRWVDYQSKDGGTLPTLTRSREILTSGDIPNAFYYSRLTTNGAGTSLGANSRHLYQENIENGVRLLCGDGKKVTVSFWARSSIANKKIGLYLAQNYGTGGSPSTAETIVGTTFNLTSSWVKYTAIITTNTLVGKTFGTANNDMFSLFFMYMWGTDRAGRVNAGTTAETYVGSGTIDIAQVQLCAGDVALPFMPKSFEEELRACQRYYYYSGDGTANTSDGFNQVVCRSVAVSTTNLLFLKADFPVNMRIIPAVTLYASDSATGAGTADRVRDENAGGLITISTPSAFALTKRGLGYLQKASPFTSGRYYGFNLTANAEL